MPSVPLSRLLSALPGAQVSGTTNLDITGLAYDSRQVEPGALFAAVPSVDGGRGGADFVGEALRRGAVAVLWQEEEPMPVTTIRVSNARAALADVSAGFYGQPSHALQLYAVTGTDGKTTTTYWLEQILAAARHRTGLIGTVELKIGDRREANLERMTTPESLDLQRLLRQMVDEGVTHVALEASSHALALDRLRSCRFAACAVTNITADHIEFHGSWEAYFQAKARLFTELAPQAPAILNRDDAHFERLAALVPGEIIPYGFHPDAQLRATDLEPGFTGTHCLVHWHGTTIPAQVPLPGEYNVANALAALGLALSAGLSLPVATQALAAAQPPPGRLQSIETGRPFRVLVDYAHTMHAFRTVLATLRAGSAGRLIAVFGATGSRDRAKRPILAQIARELTDLFILTNEDPYGEPAGRIIDEIEAGLDPAERGTRYLREDDRGQAIRTALALAHPGDTVVILGKGHEQSMVVNGRKQTWSDIRAVQDALR